MTSGGMKNFHILLQCYEIFLHILIRYENSYTFNDLLPPWLVPVKLNETSPTSLILIFEQKKAFIGIHAFSCNNYSSSVWKNEVVI